MEWTQLSTDASKHYDFIITTVPWTESTLPLMAPAALKPIIEKAGKSCLAIDLNQEVVRWTVSQSNWNDYLKFFFEEKLLPEAEGPIYELFDSMSDQILAHSPEYVGLSLFSYVSQTSNKWLCYFLKKKNPNVKILIGGPGCLPTLTGSLKYVRSLLAMGLIDYHIKGDGENALYEFLIGNTSYSGINDTSWKELTNEELSIIPTPDYTDYQLDLYNTQTLAIIGSRGCVRQCTYCDYIQNWKKFTWRTADHVFDEMMYQCKKYNIRAFKFQDSLINGNLKEFTRLTKILGEYNEKNPGEEFSWSSFYVFREWTDRSDEEWLWVKKSGVKVLAVGLESFSQRIRYAMGKKFSDESVIKHLECALKYNVKVNLLMIVGYIDETQEDIDIAKQWLINNTRFKDVINFSWGTGLGIFDNTYLGNNLDSLGVSMTGPTPQDWISKHSDSTKETRLHWALELAKLSRELGYPVSVSDADQHYILEVALKKEKNKNERR